MKDFVNNGTLSDGLRRYQEAFTASDESDIKSLVEERLEKRRAWEHPMTEAETRQIVLLRGKGRPDILYLFYPVGPREVV